jgi:hypothetical protein
VNQHLRAEAMSRRLQRTATRLAMDTGGRDLLARAFDAAMAPRFLRNLPDHHPDYLHTARTALILMDDARIADAVTLATALVTETRDPSLSPATEHLARLGSPVRAVLREIPIPGHADEPVLEALLAASHPARLVAVAERLDHARHLHLRNTEEWGEYFALTRDDYLPIALRTHPSLASRLEWWCETFERRFLGG